MLGEFVAESDKKFRLAVLAVQCLLPRVMNVYVLDTLPLERIWER